VVLELPEKVSIVEVGPRDGFQNIKQFIPTETKVKIIRKLCELGIPRIEITSFVNPKAIPQMSDAAEVVNRVLGCAGPRICALVPNLRGAEYAIEAGVRELTAVVSASESHNQANVGRNIEESLRGIKEMKKLCEKNGELWIRANLATAFGCPYEGAISTKRVRSIVERMIETGVEEVVLCDTTGMGNPRLVQQIIQELKTVTEASILAVHFHNTRGTGIANTMVALEQGITTIESSIGGMGGCPFAPGATGNVATEDYVNLFQDMGIDTGIDLNRILDCAKFVEQVVPGNLHSYLLKAGPTYSLRNSTNTRC
jgi:hydroxymethylglutaryl-CoA lyase